MASPHSGRAAALHQLLQIVEGLLVDIVLYLLHLLQFIRGAVDPAEKTVEQVMAVEQIGPQFRSGGRGRIRPYFSNATSPRSRS